jgi:ArsR family transcriptional regulator
VGEIVAATGATQSNISKHLSLLTSAGIINRQKDGQFVYYRMSNPLTMKLCELVHTELLRER